MVTSIDVLPPEKWILHNACYCKQQLVHKQTSILGLPTTFEGSSNVSYNTALLTFVHIGANTWTYKLKHAF